MTKPPENLIAPFYKKDGLTVQANINGYYRLCSDPTCETYITCPFSTCFKHWTAMADKKLTTMKEWE